RLAGLVLIERVEYAAEFWIGLGDFQNRRAGHEADIDIIAKENAARVLRINTFALERSLGEHKHLRRLAHFELIEDRKQITELIVSFERDFAFVDSLLQLRDRAARRRFAVSNRVLVERHDVRRALKVVSACWPVNEYGCAQKRAQKNFSQ